MMISSFGRDFLYVMKSLRTDSHESKREALEKLHEILHRSGLLESQII